MKRCCPESHTITLALMVSLATLLSWGTAADAKPYGHIIQRDHCTVPGETVSLGDVADVEFPDPKLAASLEAVTLTQAPAYGYSIDISQNYIVCKLKQHYGNLGDVLISGAPKTSVRRDGGTVTQMDVREAVRDYILREIHHDPELVEITFRGRETELGLPPGDIEYRVTPTGSRLAGNTSFRVEVLVDGAAIRSVQIGAFIRVYEYCVVAAEDIRSGDLFNEDNLAMEKVDVTYQNDYQKMLRGLAPTEGMVADRYLYSGRPLTEDMLKKPMLIQSGAKVKLVSRVGNIVVMADGVARERGREGDTIRVLNLVSNKMIQGCVDDNGEILVSSY